MCKFIDIDLGVFGLRHRYKVLVSKGLNKVFLGRGELHTHFNFLVLGFIFVAHLCNDNVHITYLSEVSSLRPVWVQMLIKFLSLYPLLVSSPGSCTEQYDKHSYPKIQIFI